MTENLINSINIDEINIIQDDNKAIINLSIPKESSIFEGHYDNMPVLAGAYQLALCKHFVEKYLKSTIKVKSLNRVRFTGFIVPDDPIKIQLNFESKENEYHIAIKIFKNNKKVTMAKMIAVKLKD